MILFVNCYVVFHFLIIFFNNYVSLRYIQLSLGYILRKRKELPTLLAVCSFCGICLSFGVGGLVWT